MLMHALTLHRKMPQRYQRCVLMKILMTYLPSSLTSLCSFLSFSFVLSQKIFSCHYQAFLFSSRRWYRKGKSVMTTAEVTVGKESFALWSSRLRLHFAQNDRVRSFRIGYGCPFWRPKEMRTFLIWVNPCDLHMQRSPILIVLSHW